MLRREHGHSICREHRQVQRGSVALSRLTLGLNSNTTWPPGYLRLPSPLGKNNTRRDAGPWWAEKRNRHIPPLPSICSWGTTVGGRARCSRRGQSFTSEEQRWKRTGFSRRTLAHPGGHAGHPGTARDLARGVASIPALGLGPRPWRPGCRYGVEPAPLPGIGY